MNNTNVKPNCKCVYILDGREYPADTPGQRAKILRKARGLTLEDAARKAGCTAQTICGFERGATNPAFVTVSRLADAYGASLEMIAGREPLEISG